MPIQAAANKLKNEISNFGCPPVFPVEEDPQETDKEEISAEAALAGKSKGKKSKLAVKGMNTKTVRSMGHHDHDGATQKKFLEFSDPTKMAELFPAVWRL